MHTSRLHINLSPEVWIVHMVKFFSHNTILHLTRFKVSSQVAVHTVATISTQSEGHNNELYNQRGPIFRIILIHDFVKASNGLPSVKYDLPSPQ